jgi:tRNA pseudouridine38-40 synthase
MVTNRRNIKLIIAYDGSGYHGWQRQREGVTSVQDVVEAAIGKVTGHKVVLRASGRTDTGVHAAGQVVNFFSDCPVETRRLHYVINAQLPNDIKVLRAEDVDHDFDATTSARSKLYRYTVYNHRRQVLWIQRYAYYYPAGFDKDDPTSGCDAELMQQAAAALIGEHDFASFATDAYKRKTSVRRLLNCQVWRQGYMIYFDLEGTGFLHHMVRNIVGSLLEVGRGHWPVEKIEEILASCSRQSGGPRAPANGLCLQWVRY